jgi:hypothetical protein
LHDAEIVLCGAKQIFAIMEKRGKTMESRESKEY